LSPGAPLHAATGLPHAMTPAWVLVTLVGVGCQLLKCAIDAAVNRRVALRALVTANGLPSLYGCVFGCLLTLVAMRAGIASPVFTVTGVFAGIVLHDSIRVHQNAAHGGRAARQVARTLQPTIGARWADALRPSLSGRGHRPWHVLVGGVLGALVALGFGGVG
jgi:acid phosphatase family membrane protein YuiD